MKIKYSANDQVRGRRGYEQMLVNLKENVGAVGGNPVARVVADTNVIDSDALEQDVGFTVSAATPDGSSVVINNLTPSVSSISGNTISPTNGGGVCGIEVVTDSDKQRFNRYIHRRNTIGVTTSFLSYVAGSLGEHLNQQFASRLSGKTRSQSTESIFTPETSTLDIASLIRNPSIWCSDLDMTGLGLQQIPNAKGCAAISPHHITSATHYHPSSVNFILNDNSVVTRTGITWTSVKNKAGTQNAGKSNDLSIGHFSTPLPAGVHTHKVLPSNYRSYIPGYASSFPLVNTSHSGSGAGVGRTMFVQELDKLDQSVNNSSHIMTTKSGGNMSSQLYVDWHKPYGLSGEPVFTIINGELILLSENYVRYGYSSNGGVFIADLIPEINAIMTAQHGDATYQLQEVDLSSFTTF